MQPAKHLRPAWTARVRAAGRPSAAGAKAHASIAKAAHARLGKRQFGHPTKAQRTAITRDRHAAILDRLGKRSHAAG
jgi:hypothetical protein